MIHEITDVEKTISELLPKRNEQGEKRDQGCALIIAGSRDMPGAAALCTKAALRSGAGLVTLAAPRCIVPTIQAKISEPVFMSLENHECGICEYLCEKNVSQLLKSAGYQQAVAIGPGLGQKQETRIAIRNFAARCSTPMVIDADGLNALTPYELSLIEAPTVLTPHRREFARLFGEVPQDAGQISKFLVEKAKDFKKTILLKQSPILIATPDGNIFSVPAENSGMAKGGSGDVLTGIIVALMAQGISIVNATILGASLHQKAGLVTRKKLGAFSMLPSDVIENLHEAFPKP